MTQKLSDKSLIDLINILKQKKIKIACAESLTVGHVQTMLGQISGSSEVFEGGITAYNIIQKVRHLKVNKQHAKKVNCVSERVAKEMAKGVIKKFRCNIGIGTTGFANLDSEDPYAYYAIYIKKGSRLFKLGSGLVTGKGKDRVEMQKYVAVEVLLKLLTILKDDGKRNG